MTIREAVSLVLQASVIGEKGDTLVLDMGQPLPILDLVRTLIKLSGRHDKQATIKFTGLRPGEKLIEELFYDNEDVDETSAPKIKRARGPHRDWNTLAAKLDELDAVLFLNGSATVRAKIKEILPEYSSIPESDADANRQQESWLTSSQAKIA
jgi:FlaA1/EpsC-like NDP-sugar epimerase